MKKLIFLPLLLLAQVVLSQSVGIGTTTPVSSSVLDMGPSAKPVILPRLTTQQMNSVSSPTQGMFLYNITEHQLYGYMRYRSSQFIGQSNNKWQPVVTGPRMLAWGVVDSFGTEINGGGTHIVTWDEDNRWYRVALLNPHEYYKDSMLLMVTPVGNGSWDQMPSTGELIESSARLATIKFTDASRISDGSTTLFSRRRSSFHFVLYDLRKEPPY